jgi:hypothetical protein
MYIYCIHVGSPVIIIEPSRSKNDQGLATIKNVIIETYVTIGNLR